MVAMLIGFAGGLAVLLSFAGLACGRLSAQSAAYHAMNLSGGLALVAAGVSADAWPSVAVNGSWALISAHGLARAARPRRREREPHTDERRASRHSHRGRRKRSPEEAAVTGAAPIHSPGFERRCTAAHSTIQHSGGAVSWRLGVPGGAICVTEKEAVSVVLGLVTCPVRSRPCSVNVSPTRYLRDRQPTWRTTAPAWTVARRSPGCWCQPVKPRGASVTVKVETSTGPRVWSLTPSVLMRCAFVSVPTSGG